MCKQASKENKMLVWLQDLHGELVRAPGLQQSLGLVPVDPVLSECVRVLEREAEVGESLDAPREEFALDLVPLLHSVPAWSAANQPRMR